MALVISASNRKDGLAAVLVCLGSRPDVLQYGNASSASVPVALDHAVRDGQVASGDLI
jgi:hypothetical protein